MNNAHNHQQPPGGGATAAELIKKLSQFDGSSVQFFWNLLAVQCFLSRADSGAILRSRQDEGVDILAAYPQLPESPAEGGHEQGERAPAWLSESVSSVREAISTDATIVKSLPALDGEERGTNHVLFVPLKIAEIGQAVEAFVIRASDRSTIETCREQLELTANLLGISERRLTLQKRQAGLRRLQKAMETLSAINRQNRFTSTAMALCNEVASQWRCERVSIGFLKGRYVQLKAMSHTEDFSRKMKIVQDIESAMEECL
ncbi:MAG: hypothetical protein ACYS19_14640, partial [Planctomycetota bacterium]